MDTTVGRPGAAVAVDTTAPFGGGRFRSRFTDAVWQGPTWSFAILLTVLRLAQDPDGLVRALFLVGFALVMAVTVAALFVPWRALAAVSMLGSWGGRGRLLLVPTGARDRVAVRQAADAAGDHVSVTVLTPGRGHASAPGHPAGHPSEVLDLARSGVDALLAGKRRAAGRRSWLARIAPAA